MTAARTGPGPREREQWLLDIPNIPVGSDLEADHPRTPDRTGRSRDSATAPSIPGD